MQEGGGCLYSASHGIRVFLGTWHTAPHVLASEVTAETLETPPTFPWITVRDQSTSRGLGNRFQSP